MARLRDACIVAAATCCGCYAGAAHVDAGYVTSSSGNPGRQGLALRARGALLPLAMSLRGKITREVKQVAIEPEVILPLGGVVPAYAAGGAQLLQLESVDRHFDIGAFSPVLEVGAFAPLGWGGDVDYSHGLDATVSGPMLLVNATAEYDLRFNGGPSELYYTVNGGFGFFFGGIDVP